MCSVFCFFFPPVKFDDCSGNEGVTFDVSDPHFHVDQDLNLVALQDDVYSRPVLLIHGFNAHADDMAQVDVTGLSRQSAHTLRVSNISCLLLLSTLGFLKQTNKKKTT